MPPRAKIQSPGDASLTALCDALTARADATDERGDWPADQLRLCGEHGVYEWFLPAEWGGQGWSDVDVTRGYLRLSAACLTTTFIITQRTGACRRIAIAENEDLKRRLLGPLVRGASFATVGISHLTTSRRHLATPVLRATEVGGGFQLDGFSPWVTGGAHADVVVTGATLADGRQVLVALPMDTAGVVAAEPARLVGLSASHTGEVRCDRAFVPDEMVLDGPIENVMARGAGAKSGGLQTSTLAIGLAGAAIEYLKSEAERRSDLEEAAAALARDHAALESDLLSMAAGGGDCTLENLRVRSNSLVLRAAQAAMAAAKGTGYVIGHPAGRWCREALFFLVWSCPQPVMAANLCELAGIAD